MKRKLLNAAIFGGFLSLGGAANAIQYSWDMNSNAANSHTITFGSTPAGQTMTVSAFRSGSNTSSAGALIDAEVNPDGAFGLGVYSSGELSPDDRFLDNKDGFDVLVFDSGINNFDWTSIKLGSILTGSGMDSSPGVTYWAGGNGGVTDAAFNGLCLTAGSGCTATLQGNGFSAATSLNNLTTATKPLGTPTKGRYLVVSGSLDGSTNGYDKFKISTTGGSVPAPQTMALLGIGLLAMLGMRRGRRPAVSAAVR